MAEFVRTLSIDGNVFAKLDFSENIVSMVRVVLHVIY